MRKVTTKAKTLTKRVLKKVPAVNSYVQQKHLLTAFEAEKKALKEELKQSKTWIEPGHFYSPITNDTSFKHHIDRNGIPDIELNSTGQRALIKRLAKYYKDQPFKDKAGSANRYNFDNDQFSYSDALSLYAMLRDIKPKRVIEVGSGYSSALMLDVNNQFLNNSMDLSFIEPYPTRLNSLLREGDKATVIEKFVQDVPLAEFKKLKAGDILFIDSSHVSKAGSDVNWLYFEILPILNPGVHIHIHDIFYPFEYIDEWIKQGRSWNEAYILHALLMGNKNFSIELWPHYLHTFYTKDIQGGFPLSKKNTGGSIWIKKI